MNSPKTTAQTVITRLLPLILTSAAALCDSPSYRVDSLGDGWTGTGMNELGVACGSMSPDGTALLAGVSHDGQPFELLPLPPGMQSSRAHDINDEGWRVVRAGHTTPYEVLRATKV